MARPRQLHLEARIGLDQLQDRGAAGVGRRARPSPPARSCGWRTRSAEEIGTLRAEFPLLLSKAESLYGDLLELTLSEPAPLTDGQRADFRNAVDALCSRIWTERDPVKLAEQFRATLQAALNPDQFEAFQARLLGDLENDREEEIDDLALRFSEEERVRQAVRSRYPRAELCLAQLALDQDLVEAVPTEHRRAFDRYLEALRSTGRAPGPRDGGR